MKFGGDIANAARVLDGACGRLSIFGFLTERFNLGMSLITNMLPYSVVTRPFVKTEPHLGNQLPLYVRPVPEEDDASSLPLPSPP
jgi:hypothetical protein